ncbi:MAG: hypothetical protein ACRDRJ_43800, partial [Streptosporangiaceae bacterium]
TTLVILEAGIGAAGLRPGRARRAAGWAGIAVSAAFWVIGQDLGQLYSGQATDPGTAPLVVLLAIALLGCRPPTCPRNHEGLPPGTETRPGGGAAARS